MEAPRPRIHQLDAIRGLLAIGVMVYHVVPGTPIVFGTYGVYLFFTLSGFALEHVYGGRLDVARFTLARIARLAPLWIPIVLFSAWLYGVADPGRILLNLTGAFGLVHPGATSIVTGGWSIGIEVVCYVLFVGMTRLSIRRLAVLTVATLVLRVVWSGVTWLPTSLADPAVWDAYTEIPSFLVFFVAGMLMARTVRFPEWHGSLAELSTILGDMSYGVYLLHPIVFYLTGSPIVTLALTPAIALIVRRGYEIPLGRRIRALRTDRPPLRAGAAGADLAVPPPA